MAELSRAELSRVPPPIPRPSTGTLPHITARFSEAALADVLARCAADATDQSTKSARPRSSELVRTMRKSARPLPSMSPSTMRTSSAEPP